MKIALAFLFIFGVGFVSAQSGFNVVSEHNDHPHGCGCGKGKGTGTGTGK